MENKKKAKSYLVSSGIGLLLSCYAAVAFTTTTTDTNQKNVQKVQSTSTQTDQTSYCPEVSQLVRKGLWWGAPGDWRSYGTSLVKQVSSFLGAQWVGVNVGVIICIYQGQNTSDFPVTIQRSTVVPMPSGQEWVRQSQNGRLNCYSSQVTDCPFTMPVHAQPSIQQVYQDLQSFKQSHSDANGEQ